MMTKINFSGFLVLTLVLLLTGCSDQATEQLATPTETHKAPITASPATIKSAPQETERKVPKELSTPMLIDQAFAKDEITLGEHTLYLAYAIYDYESLPQQFKSNVAWEGTMVLRDLNDRISSNEIMCSFSDQIQEELRRLIPRSVECSQ